jgi:ribonuclease Z
MLLMFLGIAFAALGIATWVSPESAAALLQLEVTDASGLTAMRAQVGGLFVGLAGLCFAAATRRSRSFTLAAATVIVAVAIGRVIGALVVGDWRGQWPPLFIEIALAAALVRHARELGAAPPRLSADWRRRALAWSAPVVIFAIALTAALDARVEMWMFEKGAAGMTGRDNSALLADDALRVGVCGSSAPLPSPDRAKACVAVFAGGKFYVVDVGPESVENLVRWGIPLSRVGAVLLTHFHSDHIGDLGELNLQTWAAGRPAPLSVYGGPGVEHVVAGFNMAYRADQGYRTAHHSERIMSPASWPMMAHTIDLGVPTIAKDRSGLVLADGDLRVTAIEVDHAPISPAYAYRFDYRGRSVVVSGDLKYHVPLAAATKGADVLISEAIARPMLEAVQKGATTAGRDRQASILHDIQDYHISPGEASKIADAAGVKLLVFYHLLPAPDNALARRVFGEEVRRSRKGEWTLASDGSLYTLPIGSTECRQGRVEY